CRVSKIIEVPIVFRNRLHGESKLTLREQWKYLEHLSRLYDYQFPMAAPQIKFLIGAIAGAIVGLSLFAFGHTLAGWPFLLALAMGLTGMIAVTMLNFIHYIRTRKSDSIVRHPYAKFIVTSLMEFVAGLAGGELAAPHTGNVRAVLIAILVTLIIRYLARTFLNHNRCTPLRRPLASAAKR
ncbi:MAG: hypothetical protein ACP5I8_14895, partial [Phycisphaerae bacterium]